MKAGRGRRFAWYPVLLLTFSIAASSLIGAFLMAAHASVQVDSSGLKAFLLLSPQKTKSWQAVHILAAGCNCSRALAAHLAKRLPLKDLTETIVIAGSDDSLRASVAGAGFAIRSVPAEEAADRFHLRGAPWLVFLSPDGNIAYAGGYATTADARDGYRDAAIWEQLRAGLAVRELPAFGCAIGRRAQSALDPLGLKYRITINDK